MASGKIKQAVNEYRQIVKRDPDDITNVNVLGDLLVKCGETDDAVGNFCKVAEHYAQKGFPQKAIAVYNKIFRLKPDCVSTLAKLAELNRGRGAIAEAKVQYTKLVDFHEKQGDSEKLLESLNALASIDRQGSKHLIRIGEICRKDSKPMESAAAFTEAGERLLAQEQIDSALDAFSKALEQDPENARAFQGYVRISLRRGTAGNAIEKLEDILNEDPENLDVRELLAECYLGLKEVAKAEEILMGLVTQDPTRYGHLTSILESHLSAGDAKAAMRILAVTADRMLSDENPEDILRWTEAVLEIDADNLEAMRLQARYHTSRGDVASATSVLERITVIATRSVAASAPSFTDAGPSEPAVTGVEPYIEEPGNYHYSADLDGVPEDYGFNPSHSETGIARFEVEEDVEPAREFTPQDDLADVGVPKVFEEDRPDIFGETAREYRIDSEGGDPDGDSVSDKDMGLAVSSDDDTEAGSEAGSEAAAFEDREPDNLGFEILAITETKLTSKGARSAGSDTVSEIEVSADEHVEESVETGFSGEAPSEIDEFEEEAEPDFDDSTLSISGIPSLEEIAADFADVEEDLQSEAADTERYPVQAVDSEVQTEKVAFSDPDQEEYEIEFGALEGLPLEDSHFETPPTRLDSEFENDMPIGGFEAEAPARDAVFLSNADELTTYESQEDPSFGDTDGEFDADGDRSEADVEQVSYEVASEEVSPYGFQIESETYLSAESADSTEDGPFRLADSGEWGPPPEMEVTSDVSEPVDLGGESEQFLLSEDSESPIGSDSCEVEGFEAVSELTEVPGGADFEIDAEAEGEVEIADGYSVDSATEGDSYEIDADSFGDADATATFEFRSAESETESAESGLSVPLATIEDFSGTDDGALTAVFVADTATYDSEVQTDFDAEPEDAEPEFGPPVDETIAHVAEALSENADEALNPETVHYVAFEYSDDYAVAQPGSADDPSPPLGLSGHAAVSPEPSSVENAPVDTGYEFLHEAGDSADDVESVSTNSFEARIDRLVAEMNFNFISDDAQGNPVDDEVSSEADRADSATVVPEPLADVFSPVTGAVLPESITGLVLRTDYCGRSFLAVFDASGDTEPDFVAELADGDAVSWFDLTEFEIDESVYLKLSAPVPLYEQAQDAQDARDEVRLPDEPVAMCAEPEEPEASAEVMPEVEALLAEGYAIVKEEPATESKASSVMSEADREKRLSHLLEGVDFFISEGFFEVASQSFQAIVDEYGYRPEFEPIRESISMFLAHTEPEAPIASMPGVHTASLLSPTPKPYDSDFAELENLGRPVAELQGRTANVLEIDEEVVFDYETCYDTATAYREMGLLDYAIREFENALKLTDVGDGTRRFFQCANMLGHCFMDYGKPDLAVTWFRRAQETPGLTDEEDLGLLYEIANALESHGKTVEAAKLFGHINSSTSEYRDAGQRFDRLRNGV